MPRHKCIYCLEEKDVAAFNREHVIPEAFGKFQNNATLIESVCADCNSYFGTELDLYLARGTPVGFERYVRGQKKGGRFRPDRRASMIMNVQTGLVAGAHVTWSETDPLTMVPVPQVAFKKGTERRWFPVSDFPGKDTLQLLMRDGFVEIEFLEVSPEAVLPLLSARGVRFDGEVRQFRDGAIRGQESMAVRATLGQLFARAVAKIAFNYLTWTHGRGIALLPQFNDARAFIRTGTNPPFTIWRAEIAELVANAPEWFYGHTIAIGCETPNQHVYALVGLNENNRRHRIELSPGGLLLHGVIRSGGHHFDLNSKQIFEVTARSSTR